MFVSSVILYLLIRKASLMKMPTPYVNLASFFIPFFVYVIFAFLNHVSVRTTFPHLLLIAALAFFCSYLGNIASLRSIENAPNPGYSLIISKSYVVLTTAFAVLFFNAPLSLKSSFAIALIVGFSVLIMIGRNTGKGRKSGLAWLLMALGAFFAWGFLSIGTKYAFSLGITVYERLMYLTLFVSAFIGLEIGIRPEKNKLPAFNGWMVLLGIGICSAAFNYFMMVALDTAPNIGYVNAVNASSISAVTIFSALLFGDEFSVRKMVGIAGVTLGLILLLV